MAEHAATKPAPPAPAATPGEEIPRPGTPLWLRVGIVMFMVAVVIGECLVAYLYLSSAPHPTAAAEEDEVLAEEAHGEEAVKAGEEHKGTASEEGHGGKTDHAPAAHAPSGGLLDEDLDGLTGDSVGQLEVDLEEFSITVMQAATNTTLRVDCHLFGTVAKDDESEFKALLEKHKNRYRDQVLMIVRSSELADFADPGLGLIKRKILAKTNELLGKNLIKSVGFNEFSLIEQ